jgi:surface polysaccharide O-acyltransferase-like enzyme
MSSSSPSLSDNAPPKAVAVREFAPDLIRAVATALVVAVHASMPLTGSFNLSWWAATTFQVLARIGVPLFVMLSGWLLLSPSRAEPIAFFLKKRVLRIGLIYVAWSFFWLAWRLCILHEPISASAAGSAMLNGKAYYHLWFFPLIIKLYLFAPLLGVLRNNASRDVLGYLAALWLASLLYPLATQLLRGETLSFNHYDIMGYVGYFVIGSLLPELAQSRRRKRLAATILCVSCLLVVGATRIVTEAGGKQDERFLGYLGPPVVLMSLAAFYLMIPCKAGAATNRRDELVGWLSRNSLGIYVLHLVVLELCWRGYAGAFATDASLPMALAIPLHTAAALFITGLLVSTIRTVPGLNRLVG